MLDLNALVFPHGCPAWQAILIGIAYMIEPKGLGPFLIFIAILEALK